MSKDTKLNPLDQYMNDVGMTDAEKELVELEASIIEAVVQARKKANITQKEVSEKTNLKIPAISRLENGNTDPRLSTLLKYLASIGKTIQIVDSNY